MLQNLRDRLFSDSKSKHKYPINENPIKISGNTSAPPQGLPDHQPGAGQHSNYENSSDAERQSNGSIQRQVTRPPSRQVAERGHTTSTSPYSDNNGHHGTFAQSSGSDGSASAPNATSSPPKPIRRKPVPPRKPTPLSKPPTLPPSRPVSPLTASDMKGETMPVSPIFPGPDFPHRWAQ